MSLNIISLGAGVQSSAMALMAAHGEITPMPDFAVFADTGDEPRHGGSVGGGVYGWLNWLEEQLPFPVFRVRKLISLGDTLIQMGKASNQLDSGEYTYVRGGGVAIPAHTIMPDGTKSKLMQTCTADWKSGVLDKFRVNKRQEYGNPDVTNWIGISRDEAHRMKNSPEKYSDWLTFSHPLVEMGISRDDCYAWMKNKGYPEPPKSACVFCPHINPSRLKHFHPKDLVRAQEIEDAITHGMRGTEAKEIYISSKMIPLSVAVTRAKDQGDMFDDFGEECGGHCGT